MAILDRFSLKGKVAIVTGAGQGIGRAIATAFAEAGANVVLAGMNVKDPEASETQLRGVAVDLEKLGVTTLPIVVDMRRPQDVQDMVREAIAAFGKIDILVNNVGGTGLTPSIELSEEAWDAGIEENISTTFLGCRYAGATWRNAGPAPSSTYPPWMGGGLRSTALTTAPAKPASST